MSHCWISRFNYNFFVVFYCSACQLITYPGSKKNGIFVRTRSFLLWSGGNTVHTFSKLVNNWKWNSYLTKWPFAGELFFVFCIGYIRTYMYVYIRIYLAHNYFNVSSARKKWIFIDIYFVVRQQYNSHCNNVLGTFCVLPAGLITFPGTLLGAIAV